MAARRLPHRVDSRTVTVVLAIAFGIGALTRMTGFSPVYAMLAGTSTGTICWWAVRSEP
jgi:hypothetical protein